MRRDASVASFPQSLLFALSCPNTANRVGISCGDLDAPGASSAGLVTALQSFPKAASHSDV